MTWQDAHEVEALLLRRKQLEADAQRARRRAQQLQDFVSDTPLTRQIRAALARKAQGLERRRAAIERQLMEAS